MDASTDTPLTDDQQRLFELISVEIATLAGRTADLAVARPPSTRPDAVERAQALHGAASRLQALTAALVSLSDAPPG